MQLVIDIGNTNVVFGVYDGSKLVESFRTTTRKEMTDDEAGLSMTGFLERYSINIKTIKKIVIGSVVPQLTQCYEKASLKYFKNCSVIIVSHELNLPVTIEFDQPHQIGADRIANAAAGFLAYGGPVIVVDFGTATTFDVINKKGAYIGGIIIPGPMTSMAELAKKASRLFEVSFEKPEHVVGKSTTEALKSGLFHGTIGQIDYIIKLIIEESKFKKCKVIATGGLSTGIENHSQYITETSPNMTLDGLRIIGEEN